MRKPRRHAPPRVCGNTGTMSRVVVVVLVAMLALTHVKGVSAQESLLRTGDDLATLGRELLQDTQASDTNDRDHVHAPPLSDNAINDNNNNNNGGGALAPAAIQPSPNGLPATSLSTDSTGPAAAAAGGAGTAGNAAAQEPKPSRTPRAPPQVITVAEPKGTPRSSSSASTAGTNSATSRAEMNRLQEIIIVCILGSVATIGLVVTVISRKIYKDTDKEDDDIFAGGVFQSSLTARRKADSDATL